jgi:Rieske Fe-S protein
VVSDQSSFTALSHRAATSLLDMPQCETCGNDYDKAMQITIAGKSHWFDSFECAIHALAPACVHCGCKVIGHGAEADGKFFCCAHCAKQEGVRGVDDRA